MWASAGCFCLAPPTLSAPLIDPCLCSTSSAQCACEDPRAARILDMLTSELNIEVQVDKPVPYMGSLVG